MGKKLDLSKPIYELVTQYPELKDIMVELGFKEIANPAMLNSVGRLTTIPKGAKIHKISMMKVVTKLMASGFELEGKMPSFVFEGKKEAAVKAAVSADYNGEMPEADLSQERIGQLKGYLKRLGDGEGLDTVRADFVDKFSDVEAAEIMKAEQELMKEGTPLSEVQKLCDIHSAFFHGSTREEKIMNAELEVGASLQRQAAADAEKESVDREIEKKYAAAKAASENPGERKAMTKALIQVTGHPLAIFTKENEALEQMLPSVQERIEKRSVTAEIVDELRQLTVHYAKKGDLLYPHLKVKYDVTGPSEVMWTVDDEIRDELGKLAKLATFDEDWYSRFEKVVTRAEEMIYKEKNILFPITAEYFTKEEWYGVYQDAKDYSVVFGVEQEIWDEAENAAEASKKNAAEALMNGEIVMPGGHMTIAQLTALLNTIPMEISFIDDNNINRYFNEGPKVFKRAGMAIDREVFACHPPKIEPMVRAILDSFIDGSKDSVPVWMEKNGRTMLVTYMAVRDKKKNYLGTVELVQDMEFAKEHFAK